MEIVVHFLLHEDDHIYKIDIARNADLPKLIISIGLCMGRQSRSEYSSPVRGGFTFSA